MADKILGEVLFFDEQKGFGFLEVKDNPNNMFFHVRNLSEAGIPSTKMKKGVRLRFRIGRPPRPKGANDICAVDIELAA